MSDQHPREDCYLCGSDGDLETHHIFPKRFGGGEWNANLVDVCKPCHKKLERIYNERFYRRIGLLRHEAPPHFSPSLGEHTHLAFDPWPHDLRLKCPACDRYGPLKKRHHVPSGVNGLLCTRCGHFMSGPWQDEIVDEVFEAVVQG